MISNVYQKYSLLILCVLLLSIIKPNICGKLTDITKGLSDEDINTALADLSLSDLRQLEQAVCDNDYSRDYHTQVLGNGQDSYANVDRDPVGNGFERKLRKAIVSVPLTHAKLVFKNNLRPKRKASFVDENYIKQLDYSFPGTVQLNDENEYMEMKRDHIRVKRN